MIVEKYTFSQILSPFHSQPPWFCPPLRAACEENEDGEEQRLKKEMREKEETK